MHKKAPGRAHRKGISILEITNIFPDNLTAEAWFVRSRWPDGIECPFCASSKVATRKNRKPLPFHCSSCRKYFSVKTGTLMQSSNLGCRTWAIGIYVLVTGLKSVSSMKLHRDLGISQKSAWFMLHRIRETWAKNDGGLFEGPAETDETHVGGKRRNMHVAKRQELKGRGPVDMVSVAGIKDRSTNKVRAQVVDQRDSETLQGFIRDNVKSGAVVYTDDATTYNDMAGFHHESVKHSVSEYVRGQAHTQGIESFWSTLKRAYKGTFHQISPKHLQRYVQEFAGRHNIRDLDTIHQMMSVARGFVGKRLGYRELVA